MNGVLVIDKPKGWTSHDVVARVRKVLQVKKAGHGGTLDPLATGVLPIYLNEATKLVPFNLEGTKEYVAILRFGQETDTLDADGKIVAETREFFFTREKLEETLRPLPGNDPAEPPRFFGDQERGRSGLPQGAGRGKTGAGGAGSGDRVPGVGGDFAPPGHDRRHLRERDVYPESGGRYRPEPGVRGACFRTAKAALGALPPGPGDPPGRVCQSGGKRYNRREGSLPEGKRRPCRHPADRSRRRPKKSGGESPSVWKIWPNPNGAGCRKDNGWGFARDPAIFWPSRGKDFGGFRGADLRVFHRAAERFTKPVPPSFSEPHVWRGGGTKPKPEAVFGQAIKGKKSRREQAIAERRKM